MQIFERHDLPQDSIKILLIEQFTVSHYTIVNVWTVFDGQAAAKVMALCNNMLHSGWLMGWRVVSGGLLCL
jgi:hypothetical protein